MSVDHSDDARRLETEQIALLVRNGMPYGWAKDLTPDDREAACSTVSECMFWAAA